MHTHYTQNGVFSTECTFKWTVEHIMDCGYTVHTHSYDTVAVNHTTLMDLC